MSCHFECDECGTKTNAQFMPDIKDYAKPRAWYQKESAYGLVDLCCENCLRTYMQKQRESNIKNLSQNLRLC